MSRLDGLVVTTVYSDGSQERRSMFGTLLRPSSSTPEVCTPAHVACSSRPCPDPGGCLARGLLDGLEGRT